VGDVESCDHINKYMFDLLIVEMLQSCTCTLPSDRVTC